MTHDIDIIARHELRYFIAGFYRPCVMALIVGPKYMLAASHAASW